jgi:putative glutamine amidotransferase
MKPIIGINVDIVDRHDTEAVVQSYYFQSVQRAGGLPVLLPPMSDDDMSQLLSRIDGLMLIGGLDYDPKHYQESACEKVVLAAPARDDFDIRLIHRAVVGTNMPILGICAGCQALNIGLGGSLIQDIPSSHPDSKVEHASKEGWEKGWNRHRVKLEAGSSLAKIYGKQLIDVPTSHHQAVKRLGAGLEPIAYAEDGIIEAVQYKDKPFVLGVQWHPERDYEGNRKLFETFIEHAAARTTVAAK